MANEDVKIYDWDDEITDDGYTSEETVTLPAGNYPFEVIKTEKAWYETKGGSIPSCNMAKVYLRVDGGELGRAIVVENLYLTSKMEWKAANFFRSVGMKKHGEPIKWSQIDHCAGEHGRCAVLVDSYQANGQTRQINRVDKFFDPEDAAPKKAFKKGSF